MLYINKRYFFLCYKTLHMSLNIYYYEIFLHIIIPHYYEISWFLIHMLNTRNFKLYYMYMYDIYSTCMIYIIN